MAGRVTIIEEGRSGRVRYAEGLRSIEGDWEFGGGDVVTIVSMGSLDDWRHGHPWALERRTAILRRIAEEVVRQRAPSCRAEIDERSGDILLRQVGAPTSIGAFLGPSTSSRPALETRDAAFVHRLTALRARLASVVFALTLVAGTVFWCGREVLTVRPASGVPLGECVRTPTHVASLIQSTDPHLPRWSGRGGDDTSSVSLLLIPLDGAEPHVVPVESGLSPGALSLPRILGSDGRTLWFDAAGLHGVRLEDDALVGPAELAEANPDLDRAAFEDPRGMDVLDGRLHIRNADHSAALDVDPATLRATRVPPRFSKDHFDRDEPETLLASGFRVSPTEWLGLHSTTELERDFAPGESVLAVASATDAKEMRRLYRGELEGGSAEAGDDPIDRYLNAPRVRAMTAIGQDELLNAAFLRMAPDSAPIRMRDPDGVLVIHTSRPGLEGTLVVSRIDLAGGRVWRVDTGLDRFALRQILPGEEAIAFVGTKPPVPHVLGEPMVLLVGNESGTVARHSLWR